MKLDVTCMRYLTKDDYRVLTAVEMGMRNHELVPVPLITSIAKLRHGGSYKILSTLLRFKLVAHQQQEYDGYRLSYLGYDILALRSFLSRGTITSVGSQIGIGKESDIFEAQTESGEEVVIKIHRLGRTSFRSVRKNRDYMAGKSKASWLYMSRLAALKEYAFMRALHAHGFPTPTPIDQNRHIVVMSRVHGSPMCQIKTGNMYGADQVFAICMNMLRRLAEHGLIHCDFNEFNLMLDENGNVTLIDFPQMVSTSHPNAATLFARDVQGLVKFFAMKQRYAPSEDEILKFEDIVKGDVHIDEEVKASGFTQEEDDELVRFIHSNPHEGDGNGDESGQSCSENEADDINNTEQMLEKNVVPNVFGILNDRNLKDRANEIEQHLRECTHPAEGDKNNIDEGNEHAPNLVPVPDGGLDDSDLSGDSSEGEENGEETGNQKDDPIKTAHEKLRRDIYRRGRGGGNKTRNFTKKRNKYGKIEKNSGSKLLDSW